jgi:cytochrome c peroxidase
MRHGPRTVGVLVAGMLAVATARAADQAPPPVPEMPRGLSPVLYRFAVPPKTVPTAAEIRLGDQLFNDTRLSVDDTVSCATCHDPAKGFVDHKPQSDGVKQLRGKRNSPTVLNAMFNTSQFWDGRAATLEDQAKLPILNPVEMGQKTPDDVVRKLRGIPEYVTAFQQVYGRAITYDDLAAALAAFERTQFAADAPFDRFLAGDANAIGDDAKRGWSLFNGKGRCTSCHAFSTVSPLFSDLKFHNIGIAAHETDFPALARKAVGLVRTGDVDQIDTLAIETDMSELGRFLVTKQQADVGAFKTPGLRNVGITAPYMHDGSMATLWDVIDHYNKGGIPNPFLDGGMQRLGLEEHEIDDLVAFLFSLTSDRFAAFGREEVARQTAQKGTRPERDTDAAMGRTGNHGDLAPNPDLKDPATLGAMPPMPIVPAAAGSAS